MGKINLLLSTMTVFLCFYNLKKILFWTMTIDDLSLKHKILLRILKKTITGKSFKWEPRALYGEISK